MSGHKKGTQTLSGESAKQNPKQRISKHNFKPKQDTKQWEIIKLFSTGKKLSCLDHHWTGDTCLHSTVDKLSKNYQFQIPRERKKLPNRRGKLTSVMLYHFNDDDIAKAKKWLN